MPRPLVSFLGKGAKGAYRKASYAFEDNLRQESEFFGLALYRWLRGQKRPPDRLLLLGTPTSMWDALRYLPQGWDEDDAFWATVEDAVAVHPGLDERLLEGVERRIEAQLRAEGLALTLQCRVVPPAVDREEQHAVLQVLAEEVRRGDELWVDVTHGYRHLPMLAVLGALHLRHSRGVKVRGLRYGALEMTTAERGTPVLALEGLLDLGDWVSALAAFEASGEAGGLADLVAAEGLGQEAAQALRDACFYEHTGEIGRAVAAYRRARAALQAAPRSGLTHLVLADLLARLSWIDQPTEAGRQMALARERRKADRYVEAASLGVEAFISQQAEAEGQDPNDRFARERARDQLNALRGRATLGRSWATARAAVEGHPGLRFLLLRDLRNALVHVRAEEHELVEHLLADRGRLVEALDRLLVLP